VNEHGDELKSRPLSDKNSWGTCILEAY